VITFELFPDIRSRSVERTALIRNKHA